MDVGRVLRVQGAVRAAAAIKETTSAGADVVYNSYHRLRREARDAIPETDTEEFDRLFPLGMESRSMDSGMEHYRRHLWARGLLEQMTEWLGGYVQEARMQVEAEEYAKARVERERRSGYQN